MLNGLLSFIPQSAFLPAMVIGGILVILGLRGIGFGIIGTIILLALLGPFITALTDALPAPLFSILALVSVFFLFKLIFGKRVAENLLSFVVWELIRAPFRFIAWLFRRPARRL